MLSYKRLAAMFIAASIYAEPVLATRGRGGGALVAALPPWVGKAFGIGVFVAVHAALFVGSYRFSERIGAVVNVLMQPCAGTLTMDVSTSNV